MIKIEMAVVLCLIVPHVFQKAGKKVQVHSKRVCSDLYWYFISYWWVLFVDNGDLIVKVASLFVDVALLWIYMQHFDPDLYECAVL